jgi:hypothetical protein
MSWKTFGFRFRDGRILVAGPVQGPKSLKGTEFIDIRDLWEYGTPGKIYSISGHYYCQTKHIILISKDQGVLEGTIFKNLCDPERCPRNDGRVSMRVWKPDAKWSLRNDGVYDLVDLVNSTQGSFENFYECSGPVPSRSVGGDESKVLKLDPTLDSSVHGSARTR